MALASWITSFRKLRCHALAPSLVPFTRAAAGAGPERATSCTRCSTLFSKLASSPWPGRVRSRTITSSATGSSMSIQRRAARSNNVATAACEVTSKRSVSRSTMAGGSGPRSMTMGPSPGWRGRYSRRNAAVSPSSGAAPRTPAANTRSFPLALTGVPAFPARRTNRRARPTRATVWLPGASARRTYQLPSAVRADGTLGSNEEPSPATRQLSPV